jgi:hypothetical protein
VDGDEVGSVQTGVRRLINDRARRRAGRIQLAKYPTNHGVEKEPTESEEPSDSGEWSDEVDTLGLP